MFHILLNRITCQTKWKVVTSEPVRYARYSPYPWGRLIHFFSINHLISSDTPVLFQFVPIVDDRCMIRQLNKLGHRSVGLYSPRYRSRPFLLSHMMFRQLLYCRHDVRDPLNQYRPSIFFLLALCSNAEDKTRAAKSIIELTILLGGLYSPDAFVVKISRCGLKFNFWSIVTPSCLSAGCESIVCSSILIFINVCFLRLLMKTTSVLCSASVISAPFSQELIS